MKSKTACFSGHRRIPTEQYKAISERLTAAILGLIAKGYRYFGAGGARGFDMLAALTVLKLKQQYPWIYLILVLPCLSQTRGWSEYDRIVYAVIQSHANKVVYTAQEYSKECMHRRNRHLVDNSSACICYFTGKAGGTAYTVGYAQRCGLEIINVAHDSEIHQHIYSH